LAGSSWPPSRTRWPSSWPWSSASSLGCSRAVGPRAALAAGSLLTIAAFTCLLVIAALLPGGIDQGPVLVVIPLAVASAFVMITASLVRWVLASLKGHR